ncbi:AMP-binding protein [Streptomyces sp. NBC_01358]|uniref:AMP-binding protein n=1 Tax=Streptomyces sp. NBC_01358 TaxID=2903837 RepID=UPI002E36D9B0|nr:AMP-binding protein [Streptomyces sp. NBC_01358]
MALFGAALAGVPFVPLDYRLAAEQLGTLIARHPGAEVLRQEDLDSLLDVPEQGVEPSPLRAPDSRDEIAVILYTSGTTAAPKAALLRHRHLLAHVFATQEFGMADPDEVTLVALPPYHVAGLMNLLSNLYTGRRIAYDASFDPERWMATVREEGITDAMVVPTMLAQITEVFDDRRAEAP